MLKGKSGVITGGARGIGKATCIAWVKNGAKIVVADIDYEEGKRLANELNQDYPSSVIAVRTDVSNKEDVKLSIHKCVEEFGSIHLFFSNAGILPTNDTIQNQPDESFMQTLQVNTLGAYFAIKYASIAMKETMARDDTATCSIVLTGSIAAIRADHTPLSYTASKGALMSMVARANDELQTCGIRVNAVVPGGVNTELYLNVARSLSERGLIMRGYNFKRYPPIEPQDIANIVLFLASDLSKAIKGQVVIADGGMSQSMGSQPYPSKLTKSKL